MTRLLIGGSPCTHWSIAQSKNRETEPSGIGWELFRNYLIAKEKYHPDYFLYENNVSAAPPIKAAVKQELGVGIGKAHYIEINSALVSAQMRKRFYVHNIPNVGQSKDKGILLRDVLESGTAWDEKSYALTASHDGAIPENTIRRKQRTMIAESVRIGTVNHNGTNIDSQGYRVYSAIGKSVALCGNGGGGGAKTELYAVPCGTRQTEKSRTLAAGYCNKSERDFICDITTKGQLGATGVIEPSNGKAKTIYEVKDGLIGIKGKQYPINLPDGLYIIRKLTVNECRRLQTIPEWYVMPCSNAQNYKMLGNGWTVDVVKHILSQIPDIRHGEEIEVLSMYDGMSCGQIALRELGANVIKYSATEIDKYCIQTTQANFPNTIQLGDAFQVRDWEPWKSRTRKLVFLFGLIPLVWIVLAFVLLISERNEHRRKANIAKLTREMNDYDQGDAKTD